MKDINIEEILNKKPNKIILSNKLDKDFEYRKIEVLPVVVAGKEKYQISKYTEKQVFQDNVTPKELTIYIEETLSGKMFQMNCFFDDEELSFKITKKGKVLSQSRKIDVANKQIPATKTSDEKPANSHNRKKNYIINEGEVIAPLVDMGVFTKEGKVVQSMYDKFRQINRFVEIVDDVISSYNKEEIYIIDFGCGKSYLTFILYHYLVNIKNIKAHITGLDLKEDVIRKCNDAAKRYGYNGLNFKLGDINGYKSDDPVDMVVTLHACDTATDYALYNAVSWNARYILSVPCCQHELNKNIDLCDMKPIMDYGIIKERVSALATDAIRGNMLKYRGYKTNIMEFVDMAHSPKNLLIRAVKSNIPKNKREESFSEVKTMCKQMSFEPLIVHLLSEDEEI